MPVHHDAGVGGKRRRRKPKKGEQARKDAIYREQVRRAERSEAMRQTRKIQNDKCPVCLALLKTNDTMYWPGHGTIHAKCWKRRNSPEHSSAARKKKNAKPKQKMASAVTVRYIDFETGKKVAKEKKYTSIQGQRYQKYINSEAWAAKRRQYWAFYGYSCKAKGCEATADLHVHHHTYERLGNERLSDLVGLCVSHHDAVHRHHDSTRRKESLTRSTEIVTGLILSR